MLLRYTLTAMLLLVLVSPCWAAEVKTQDGVANKTDLGVGATDTKEDSGTGGLVGPIPSSAVKPAMASDPLPEKPVFPEPGQGPVVLRYKFAKGDRFALELQTQTRTSIEMGPIKVDVPMTMGFEADVVTDATEAGGNAWMTMTITRVTLTSAPPGQPGISFDSHETPAPNDPTLKPLAAMVGAASKVVVTPLGEVLEMSSPALDKILSDIAAAAPGAQGFQESMAQLSRGTFIQLSKQPVSAGDVYDAGHIDTALPGLGTMRNGVKYRIASVSSDCSSALLEPILSLSFLPSPGLPVKVTANVKNSEGWLLFDVEKGNVTRSAVRLAYSVEIKDGQQTMLISTQLRVTYGMK